MRPWYVGLMSTKWRTRTFSSHDAEMFTEELTDHVHRKTPRDELARGNRFEITKKSELTHIATISCDAGLAAVLGRGPYFVTKLSVLAKRWYCCCMQGMHTSTRLLRSWNFMWYSRHRANRTCADVLVTQVYGLYSIEVQVPSRKCSWVFISPQQKMSHKYWIWLGRMMMMMTSTDLLPIERDTLWPRPTYGARFGVSSNTSKSATSDVSIGHYSLVQSLTWANTKGSGRPCAIQWNLSGTNSTNQTRTTLHWHEPKKVDCCACLRTSWQLWTHVCILSTCERPAGQWTRCKTSHPELFWDVLTCTDVSLLLARAMWKKSNPTGNDRNAAAIG